MLTSDDIAIQAALDGDWEKALRLNQMLLEKDPQNTEALNRLAYAHAQLGNYEKACIYCNKTLAIDPYNPIAKKNLEKFLRSVKSSSSGNDLEKHTLDHHIDPDMFLEDAEKTRIVNLVNLGPKQTLASLTIGEEVFPCRKGYELQIKLQDGTYIGALPDDIGRTLMKNKQSHDTPCSCLIKNIEDNEISIYLKWHQ